MTVALVRKDEFPAEVEIAAPADAGVVEKIVAEAPKESGLRNFLPTYPRLYGY